MSKQLFFWIKLTLFGALISNSMQAQNFVYNSSFENGDHSGAKASLTGAMPSATGTANYLDHWERANNDNNCFHSPDWFRRGAPDGINFSNPLITADNAAGPLPVITPNTGYGMLGLAAYELIQQKYDKTGLLDAIADSPWNSITFRMWMRISNNGINTDINTKDLKVYLMGGKVKYKNNNPSDHCDNDPLPEETPGGEPYGYCNENYRKYTALPIYKKEIFSLNSPEHYYTQGEWHLIEHTFTVPADIHHYDHIVIDIHDEEHCISPYLFIDDVQLLVGCEDLCSPTDGPMGDFLLSNVVHNSSLFTLTNLDNISKLRLEIFSLTGGLTYFDETVSCLNGIDHDLFWDGKNAGGSHLANAYYGYRITATNDCGEQVFSGMLLKNQDYLGSESTNFDEDCHNGFNVTPEPCCVWEPDFYIDNETLVGPNTSWSAYIIIDNIYACTEEPDFSDEVRINHDAKVLFRAGDQVTLAEGFNTQKGAVFCAEIKGCPRGATSSSQRLVQIYEDTETAISSQPFKVFPNPASNFVRLEYITLQDNQSAQIRVVDINGKEIIFISTEQNNLELDTHRLTNGIYFITIQIGLEYLETQKLIIQK